jgi:hypothetical protein
LETEKPPAFTVVIHVAYKSILQIQANPQTHTITMEDDLNNINLNTHHAFRLPPSPPSSSPPPNFRAALVVAGW